MSACASFRRARGVRFQRARGEPNRDDVFGKFPLLGDVSAVLGVLADGDRTLAFVIAFASAFSGEGVESNATSATGESDRGGEDHQRASQSEVYERARGKTFLSLIRDW